MKKVFAEGKKQAEKEMKSRCGETIPQAGGERDRLIAEMKGFCHKMIPDPYNPVTREATKCKHCKHVSTHITCDCKNDGICLTRTKEWSTSHNDAWELWDELQGRKVYAVNPAGDIHQICYEINAIDYLTVGITFADVVSKAWIEWKARHDKVLKERAWSIEIFRYRQGIGEIRFWSQCRTTSK